MTCDIKDCYREGCLNILYDCDGMDYEISLCEYHIKQLMKRKKTGEKENGKRKLLGNYC